MNIIIILSDCYNMKFNTTSKSYKLYNIKLEVSNATTYRSKCKSKDKCSRVISRYCPGSRAIYDILPCKGLRSAHVKCYIVRYIFRNVVYSYIRCIIYHLLCVQLGSIPLQVLSLKQIRTIALAPLAIS